MATTRTKQAIAKKENSEKATPKPIVAKEIDPNQYITVRSGFQGQLIYVSKKTGETFIWDDFGSEQEMELRELRNAKNNCKDFFINNWFMFEDDWVVDYLGVGRYYKNALGIDELDGLFEKSPSEIKTIIEGLSDGQKKTVEYRARMMIADKQIDSLKVIAVLEETLGVELIEK